MQTPTEKPTRSGLIKRLVCSGLVQRFLFNRGLVLIHVHTIEWLDASSLANHVAQKKHPQDSWDRGYFNGLADQASKTASMLKSHYPLNDPHQPLGK